jgi:hypothetical protein
VARVNLNLFWACLFAMLVVGCDTLVPPDDHAHDWKGGEESRAEPAASAGEVTPPVAAEPVSPEPTIVHSSLGPEDLVRHYLMLGSAGDLSRIADFVEPDCYRGPIGRVDGVRLVGTLMNLEALTLKLESQDDDSAVVSFHLVGGVVAGESRTEISIEGVELGEQVAVLTSKGVERRGRLKVALSEGLWRVTCGLSFDLGSSAGGVTP